MKHAGDEEQSCAKNPQAAKSEYTRLCEIEVALKAYDAQDKKRELEDDEPRKLALRTAMGDILEQVNEVEADMKGIRNERDMKFGTDRASGMCSGTVPKGPYYDSVNNYLDETLAKHYIHDVRNWMESFPHADAEEYRRRMFIQSSCTIHDPDKKVLLYKNIILFWDRRGVEFVLQEICQLEDLFGHDLQKKREAMVKLKAELSSVQRKFIEILQKYPEEHKRSTVLRELPRVQKLLGLYQEKHEARQKRFSEFLNMSLTSHTELVLAGKVSGLSKQFQNRLIKSTTACEIAGSSMTPLAPDTESAAFKKAEKRNQKAHKKNRNRGMGKPSISDEVIPEGKHIANS